METDGPDDTGSEGEQGDGEGDSEDEGEGAITGRGLRHVTIVGLPGTGKTSLARDMFKRCLGAAFLNMGHETIDPRTNTPYFPNEKTGTDMNEALQYLFGGSRYVWNCECWEVRPFISEVLKRQRMASPKNPLHIFVDEAHLAAPRGSINMAESLEKNQAPNELGLIATNGRRWNIQCVWITQRPQFLDPYIYRTAEYKIFFRLDPGDILYFKTLGITIPPIEGNHWEVKQS